LLEQTGSLVMPKKNREQLLARSAKSLQENAERAGPAAGASYTLIGAIILLGGIGYALDKWRGTSPWFLLGGLALGLIIGFYELAKTVWHR
jgi:F0F1-type ATP synthase assembly protein I